MQSVKSVSDYHMWYIEQDRSLTPDTQHSNTPLHQYLGISED